MPKSSFGFSKPEQSPGFMLWQTTITWQRLIKTALESYGISHAQFVIMAVTLWLEEQHLPPIQTEIVNTTKLDKMTVSKSLKKLTSDMLMQRNEHKQDTRAKTVILTAKGRTLIKKLIPLVEQIDKQFFDAINKSEQKQFLTILTELTRN